MQPINKTENWPDLALGLYDRLSERDSEITYKFKNMNVFVPSVVGQDADHAHWKVDGAITITTEERRKEFKEEDVI